MSGGAFNYQQYQIEDIANSIEEEIENQKKPEPPTHKHHYISVMKKIGKGVSRGVYPIPRDTVEGAKRWLLALDAYEKDGKIYDKFDTYKEGDKEIPCEYVISEGDYDEYDEGHDECYYGSRYSEETIKEFKNAVHYLRIAAVYAQRVDWLLSGDDGEDSFHKRLKKELDEIK